ncbi:MAG: potassium channel protein [Methanomassiliicoccales archaeon]|nr:MAG: potassium channel protein [Methanomassiliicoccales archaeon]
MVSGLGMQDNIIRRRVAVLIASVIALLVLSPIGYMIINRIYEEGKEASFIDAFFWTVATITTMGAPGDLVLTSDVGRVYTVIVVFSGIALFFIGFPFFIIGPWLEEQVKKATSPERIPLPDEDHVIVCGYSEIGEEVIDDLELHNVPYILIDRDKSLGDKLVRSKTPFIIGDARDADVLKRANIDKAISIVAAENDSKNPIICLTAKSIKPDLRIIASVDDEEHKEVLMRAGATKVVSPRTSSGVLLANLALSRFDVDIKGRIALLDKMHIWQYPITPECLLANRTLNETGIREKTGATVIGLWRNGTLIINPSANERLPADSILVTIGTPEQLSKVGDILTGEEAKTKKKKKEEKESGGSEE